MFHQRLSHRAFFIVAGLVGIVPVAWAAPAQASEWRVAAFSGASVSVVAVNQRSSHEMAAIVNGNLQLSHDAGVTWLPGLLSVPARTISFDLVYAGRLYAGTGSGIYISDNGGMTWQPFGASITRRKIVTALQTTEEYVYAALYDGAGTPVRVWRFDASGEAQDMNLPSDNIAAFDYDYASHTLYVGAAGGVYQSSNNAASWSGGGRGAGLFTAAVAVKEGLIWQLSADGLFRSNDNGASWNKLAGPGNINGTFYGHDMHLRGLAVSGNQAFYGAWSIGFPYRFLVTYDGSAARSLLNVKIASVARHANRIWAASDNGLWANDIQGLSLPRVYRPVLLIPGILGSLPTMESLASQLPRVFTGFWDRTYQTPLVLDPVRHTYDGLLQALQSRGFSLDTTLFVFPYNWMQDNAQTAAQLSQKLHDIRQKCHCSQVDVVAHSMGGLVARRYIQSTAYHHDIRNLIQLGTPNAGSVAAYEVWEGGVASGLKPDSDNLLLNFIASALNNPDIAVPRAELLRRAIPSIGQLLPVFDYLSGRRYPAGYPVNPFLESLNLPADIARLKERVAFHVVGAANRSTLRELTVAAVNSSAIVWPHGSIVSPVFGMGDGTVLQASLEAAAKSSLMLSVGHLQLVSDAAPFILQIIMGEYVPDVTIPLLPPQRFLGVYAAGPVALTVTSPSGQIIDDSKIGIAGAYYSGSTVKPQLAFIPRQGVGDYAITLKGTGSGAFQVGAAELNPDTMGETAISTYLSGESSVLATIAPGEIRRYIYKSQDQQLIAIDSFRSGIQPESKSDRIALSEPVLASFTHSPVFGYAANAFRADPKKAQAVTRHNHIERRNRVVLVAAAASLLLLFMTVLLIAIHRSKKV
ncbi:MAG TPA: hypothetical protein VF272_00670 [Candidatus Saccharimonadia bacterium]